MIISTVTESSMIKHVLYDSSTQNLYLLFVRDRLYCYHAVPENIVREMLSSSSIGRYVNSYFWSYSNEGMELSDPIYQSLLAKAELVSRPQGHAIRAVQSIRGTVKREWCDTTEHHVCGVSSHGMPFVFSPLKDEGRYPEIVRKAQSIFRSIFHDYQCPLGVAGALAIKSHDALLSYLPDASRPYLKSVLNGLNVVVEVRSPRRSKAGDIRLDSARGIAYMTLNENLNSYKMLCVLLHELAHAMNHCRYSPHDDGWKAIFSCLLSNTYLYFPEKYRQEILWMIVNSPVATRASNFNGNGILSGCGCEEPHPFFENSIDLTAESKPFSEMVLDYAMHASFEAMKLLLDDESENILKRESGRLARAMIVSSIDGNPALINVAMTKIGRVLPESDTDFRQRVESAIKRMADGMVRCWYAYNPLERSHVQCFDWNYRGGNPWIDELIELVARK